MSVRVATAAGGADDSDLADALALVIQREVAEGHAVVISEDELEELDLVDDQGGHPPAPMPPLAAAISTGVQHAVGWIGSAVANVRAHASHAPAGHPPRPAAPVAPPAPVQELAAIPFAKDAAPAVPKRRGARAAAIAAGLVVATVAAGLGVRWLRASTGASRAAAAPTAAPTATPEPAAPARAPEVEAAIVRLPHLAPDTVQFLVETSQFAAPEPADVFRRARQAQRKGAAALPSEEAQELAVLERAALVRLVPAERERILAYDRMRAGRDLVPAEDARVMSLFARAVRALPAEQRARLQALYAKAIAAALAPAAGVSSPVASAVR
jgi:hypothetical protein